MGLYIRHFVLRSSIRCAAAGRRCSDPQPQRKIRSWASAVSGVVLGNCGSQSSPAPHQPPGNVCTMRCSAKQSAAVGASRPTAPAVPALRSQRLATLQRIVQSYLPPDVRRLRSFLAVPLQGSQLRAAILMHAERQHSCHAACDIPHGAKPQPRAAQAHKATLRREGCASPCTPQPHPPPKGMLRTPTSQHRPAKPGPCCLRLPDAMIIDSSVVRVK